MGSFDDEDRCGAPGMEVVVDDGPTEPVDLLVDTVGGPLLSRRLGSVRPGGRAVLIGYTAGEQVCLSIPDLLALDVSLLPLNMMRTRVPKDVASSLLARFADDRLHVAVEDISRGTSAALSADSAPVWRRVGWCSGGDTVDKGDLDRPGTGGSKGACTPK